MTFTDNALRYKQELMTNNERLRNVFSTHTNSYTLCMRMPNTLLGCRDCIMRLDNAKGGIKSYPVNSISNVQLLNYETFHTSCKLLLSWHFLAFSNYLLCGESIFAFCNSLKRCFWKVKSHLKYKLGNGFLWIGGVSRSARSPFTVGRVF